jgi:hypothetical protein
LTPLSGGGVGVSVGTTTAAPAAPTAAAPTPPSASATALVYSPAQPLSAATRGAAGATYVWSPDLAGSADLSIPGSVRLTLYGAQPPAADPSLSLIGLSDPSLPALPAGHTFIDVWGIQNGSPYDRIDLTARYDDALVRQLGKDESRLALWVYDGQWEMLTGPEAGRDVAQHILWGTTNQPIRYVGVSAPEPAAAGLLTAAAAGLLLARRRRRKQSS